MGVQFFTDSEMDEYMRTQWAHHPIFRVYLDATLGPMRTDIFRYCITFDKGGFWFDISKGLTKPIYEMCKPQDQVFLTFEKNRFDCGCDKSHDDAPDLRIANFGFGFSRGHKLLEILIDQIVSDSANYRGKRFENPKDAVVMMTGPMALTHAAIAYTLETGQELKTIEVDFESSSIFSLPGSEFRYWTKPSYYFSRDSIVLI
jgi:mannosyltransferase OCH1-like enzyme